MTLDVLHPVLEVRCWLEDHAPGRQHGEVHHRRQPVDVEQRHDRHDVVLAVVHRVAEPGRALHGVRHERPVREHRALRRAGRAAGVLEERDVIGAYVGGGVITFQGQDLLERDRAGVTLERHTVPVLLLLREREQRAEDGGHLLLDVRHDDVADLRALARRLDRRVQARQDDDRLGARIGELVAQLGRRVERVAGHDDRADAQGAEERDHELRAVGEIDRDAVTLLYAERAKARGESLRVPEQLRVRLLRVVEDRRRRIGVALRRVVEERVERDPRVVDRRRHVLVVVRRVLRRQGARLPLDREPFRHSLTSPRP